MSLDYDLTNCKHKTNGDLMDAIQEALTVSETRAGELVFNICASIMLADWKLESEEDIPIILHRIELKGQPNIVNETLLNLAIGIQTNVEPKEEFNYNA